MNGNHLLMTAHEIQFILCGSRIQFNGFDCSFFKLQTQMMSNVFREIIV